MVQDNNRRMKDSGIPWIGMIPSDWEVEPIGRNIHEVDNPNVGGTETNALQFKAGTIISKSVGDSKYHPTTLEAYNVVDEGVIMLNGLNLSFDLISQRVGLVQEKGVITSAYLAIKPNEQIKSEFLTYLFKAYDARKALHAMGKGLRQTLAWKELKCYSVVYPPLPTQQRIADFLDRKCAEIDELAALQQTMIAELKRYKQSVITEAVTKGLDPNVAMKDSGVEWIGEIPEGWGTYRIKYNTFLKGRIGWQGLNSSDFIDEGYCLITGTDFDNIGGINWSTCYRISKERFDEDTLLHVKNGDLLMTKDGTVGKMAYIQNLPEEASLNSHLLIIRQLTKSIDNRFLYWAMLSEEFKGFCSIYQSGSIMNSISQSVFGDFKCACPPSTEQQQIADYLDQKCAEIDELIAIKQQQIEALKEYKKSVIFEYVTGKKEIL